MKTKIQLSQCTEFYENLNICIRSRKWSGFSVCTTYASIHTHVYGVWQYITFIKMCQMIIGMYWKDINSKAKEHTHTQKTKFHIEYPQNQSVAPNLLNRLYQMAQDSE